VTAPVSIDLLEERLRTLEAMTAPDPLVHAARQQLLDAYRQARTAMEIRDGWRRAMVARALDALDVHATTQQRRASFEELRAEFLS
jgi:hypothetical protein